jgi:4-hydroxybenzoate polyprenyltransferase
MTCEALVIGSVAGLALTAAVLSFQVITDRKADARNTPKLKEKGRLTANTITT